MSFPNKDKSMSFNADDNCEFDPIPEQVNQELEKSFSDLSSISKEIIKDDMKEEIPVNIELSNPEKEAPKIEKKEKKRRTKEDLDKTPLYIFDCIFCAKEKTAFKILSTKIIDEFYSLSVSKQDYLEISDLVNFKNIILPSKKLKYYNSLLKNLEFVNTLYTQTQSETIMKNKFEENGQEGYRPQIRNKELFSRICVKKNLVNKENLILFKKRSSKAEKNKLQNFDITDIKFVGFETDFINKENEFFDKNDVNNNQSNNLDNSSKILSKLENKRVKFTDISFESQIHDIYNPKYSSDESKENLNFSINISNFSSQVLNNARQNNLINNNLKTGVSNSEILSPENISIINKSDNQQEANYNKASQSYICYSHINKFSLPNNLININCSEFKSYNDSKNNSHILINDKKFIIDDNSLSKTSSKFYSLLPPKSTSKLLDTNRRRDKSKQIIEEKNTLEFSNKEDSNKPLEDKKKSSKPKKSENMVISNLDNLSFKKKSFQSSLYGTNTKKSDVQARLNINNYETNYNPLLCSYEKKTPKGKTCKKLLTDKSNKLNKNIKKLLEFNNTIKGYETTTKDNSFSINKYMTKSSKLNCSFKKTFTKQEINTNQSLKFDSTLSMSSPKYQYNKTQRIQKLVKIYSSGMDIKNMSKNSSSKINTVKKNKYATTSLKNESSKKYL